MNVATTIESVGPRGRRLRFENPDGVYPVNRYQSLWLATTAYHEACIQLAETGRAWSGFRVWEPCCGGGPVAVTLSAAGAGRVVATDIDPRALDACRRNAETNNCRLDRTAELDLLGERPGEAFDMIACNPPCRPTDYLPSSLLRHTCDGGPDGIDYYTRLIAESARHLAPGGRLVFVLVSTLQYDAVAKQLDAHFPGAWRISANSPVAQPFLAAADTDNNLPAKYDRPHPYHVWRQTDGYYWRMSWVVVAGRQPLDAPWTPGLSFDNHDFDSTPLVS